MTMATDAARAEPRAQPGERAAPGDPQASPFTELAGVAAQLKAILGFYLQTRIDRVRVAVTKAIASPMLLAVAAVVGVGLLVAAAFFVVVGAIQALASVVHAPGAASLIVGGALLAIAFAGVLIVRMRMRSSLRRKLAAKYRDHYARQRDELGVDVAQIAGRPHASLGADGKERRP